MVPLVDDNQASYGVRMMMDRLIDLMDEPAEGIHRKRKFDFASTRAPGQANSVWTRGRQAVATAIAQRMSSSDGGIAKLLRFLRMTSVLHLSRLRLASFAVFFLPMLGLIFLNAASEVAERRESVRQTVRGAAGLPSSFALDADKVWDLDLVRLDQIRSALATKLLRLGLHDDHLVRPPDFTLALKVNEAGQPFHALMPVPSTNGGRLARDFLVNIDCSAGRTCREAAPDAVRIIMPADPQRDGARVLNYAGALSGYLHGASSEDIKKYLDKFEKGRDGQWGKSIETAESPTKQILLPALLQRLLLAHAALRDEAAKLRNGEGKADSDGRNSFRRYGKSLDDALDEYAKQSASLALARKSRLPMNLGQELRVIGVGGNVLNAHLLATAVASAETFPDLQKEAFRRFGRFGTQLDADKVFDVEAYAGQYPELLCLYHHMRRVPDRRSTSGYAKACEASSPTADNPFEAERLLVDAKFWAGDRTRTSIALERYAPLIRDAAERAAKGEQDPKVLASLQPLRQLPDERPWWMLLIEPRSLMLIAGVVVLAAFMSWLVVLLWCQVLAAHRLVSPYTRDVQQI